MFNLLSLIILLAATAMSAALALPTPGTLSTAEFAALVGQRMRESSHQNTGALKRRTDDAPLGADTYYDMVFAVSQLRYQQSSTDARSLWPTADANDQAQSLAQIALLLDAERLVDLPLAINSSALYATGQDIDSAMLAWIGCDKCQHALVSSKASALGLGRAGDYWVLYVGQS